MESKGLCVCMCVCVCVWVGGWVGEGERGNEREGENKNVRARGGYLYSYYLRTRYLKRKQETKDSRSLERVDSRTSHDPRGGCIPLLRYTYDRRNDCADPREACRVIW